MSGSAETGPMAAIRQFVEAFNNDNVDLLHAACTDETSIVDDFPPHVWTGPGATTRWYRDMARMATQYRMSNPSVALGEPRHVTVSDQGAYVVVPIEVRWLQDGTPTEATGFMTVGLRQVNEEWCISACAWTWN